MAVFFVVFISYFEVDIEKKLAFKKAKKAPLLHRFLDSLLCFCDFWNTKDRARLHICVFPTILGGRNYIFITKMVQELQNLT